LRRADGKRLGDTDRRLLRPMITLSDNDAAGAIYARVGGEGLRRVSRATGMRRFDDVGHWAGARITAADQARFFLRIDKLVPAAHRRYARKLLSSIVTSQRWGIARAARREHVKAFFKGGWRNGITHQIALLERGGRRLALAVLTSGSPSMAYAEETIERIASRVIDQGRRLPRAGSRARGSDRLLVANPCRPDLILRAIRLVRLGDVLPEERHEPREDAHNRNQLERLLRRRRSHVGDDGQEEEGDTCRKQSRSSSRFGDHPAEAIGAIGERYRVKQYEHVVRPFHAR
jgi:hypothetical protein